MSLGSPELLILLVILLLLFGSSLLPKLARSLSRTREEFDRGQSESDSARDSSS